MTEDCYECKVIEENKVLEVMKNVDVRKAMGLDGVTGWILREYPEQLVETVHDIVKVSLKEKVPVTAKEQTQ